MLYRSYSREIPALLRAGALTADGCAIWAMWSGYLDEHSGVRLRRTLAAAGVPLVQHHTSGHASPSDLARLVGAMAPRRVVPIHTDHPELAPGGPLMRPVRDADWWEVGSTDSVAPADVTAA